LSGSLRALTLSVVLAHTMTWAAPITDASAEAPLLNDKSQTGDQGARGLGGAGGVSGRPGQAEASTGVKHLDLILEMQSQGNLPAQARPQTEAEVVKAAAEARAARERLRALGQVKAGVDAGFPGNAAGLPAKLDSPSGDGVPERAPAREWVPPPTGNGGGLGLGGLMGGGGRSDMDAERDADRMRNGGDRDRFGGNDGDDDVLRALPPEVRAFLRDHRYELLGGMVLVGLLGVMVKLYSRRI
jgi:hypothetical protein